MRLIEGNCAAKSALNRVMLQYSRVAGGWGCKGAVCVCGGFLLYAWYPDIDRNAMVAAAAGVVAEVMQF